MRFIGRNSAGASRRSARGISLISYFKLSAINAGITLILMDGGNERRSPLVREPYRLLAALLHMDGGLGTAALIALATHRTRARSFMLESFAFDYRTGGMPDAL